MTANTFAAQGMVSVDDHLVEPPHLWEHGLPTALRDRAPRVERDRDGADQWIFEDTAVPLSGMMAVAGAGEAGYRESISYDAMRPSCYDPKARVEDLDRDGIAASACFPTWIGFSGTRLSGARDKGLGLACIQTYNDFVIDEWCASAPGRYIPVVVVPLWDQRAAADEAERTIAKGARGIAFSENPSKQGYPSIHDPQRGWDRLFGVVSEAGVPLCLHIGSSSHIFHPPSPDSPLTVMYTTDYLNSQYTLIEWLMSDNFDRFPKLRVCLSEGGIGWVPHCVERCDFKWERYARWAGSPPKELPSTYLDDHVSFCLMEDEFGALQIERIGIANVLVETDFPHADSHWPASYAKIASRLGHLDARARDQGPAGERRAAVPVERPSPHRPMNTIVVRGGAVIDGTGLPSFTADVAICDGRIVEVGHVSTADTSDVIDADGLVVAPGFIDPHVHYDAQIMWDPALTPSSMYGVTTVIGGNCGFGVAPLGESNADYMLRLLANVEGMSIEALEAGSDWSWDSFDDWLGRVTARIAVNAAFFIGHSTVRRYVMGADAHRA